MWKEAAALLMTLIFPALVMAQVPGPQNMIEKIIKIHGTYLPSPDPMPCGDSAQYEEAGDRVRKLFDKIAGWPNFRALCPMGKWEKDVQRCRLPVDGRRCRAMLEETGVDFEPLVNVPGIEHPVLLEPEVNGVKLKSKVDLVMACDMALAIVEMTRHLSELGVEAVGIFSMHRPESTYSFHSLGLAMDVNYFKSSKWHIGVWIKPNFEKSDKYRTCNYKAESRRGAFLMDVICRLWEEKVFNTIITPNYNEAHYNHLHFDVRPGDNRFYLR